MKNQMYLETTHELLVMQHNMKLKYAQGNEKWRSVYSYNATKTSKNRFVDPTEHKTKHEPNEKVVVLAETLGVENCIRLNKGGGNKDNGASQDGMDVPLDEESSIGTDDDEYKKAEILEDDKDDGTYFPEVWARALVACAPEDAFEDSDDTIDEEDSVSLQPVY